MVVASYIDDLTLLFGIISSFSECFMNLIAPGGVLLLGAWAKLSYKMRVSTVLFVAFGFFQFCASNYAVMIKLKREFA